MWKQNGFMAVAELAVRARGILVLPLLARLVGARGIGVYAQVAAIAAFISPVIGAGTDSAAMRWLAGKGRREIEAGILSLLLAQTALSSLLLTIAVICSRPLGALVFRDSRLGWYAVAAVLLALGSAGVVTCKSLFRLSADAGSYSRLTIIHCFTSVAGAFAGTLLKRSLSGTLIGLISGDLAIMLGTFILLVRRGGLRGINFGVLGRLFTTGAWLIPAAYLMWVVNMADRSFLTRWRGLEEVGIYATAYGIAFALVQGLFNPFWVLYPPLAARHINAEDYDGLAGEFRRSMNPALFLALPCLGLVTVLARPVLTFVASSSFASGAPMIPIIGAGYIFSMLTGYYDTCLLLKGRQKWTTIALAAAAAANIGLNILLIPRLGALGAAEATLAAFALQFVITVFLATRQIRLVPDMRFLAKTSCALIGMLVVSIALPREKGLVWLCANAALSFSAYVVFFFIACRGRFTQMAFFFNG
jgi:O-antigen/teichoic acid export membrane protein